MVEARGIQEYFCLFHFSLWSTGVHVAENVSAPIQMSGCLKDSFPLSTLLSEGGECSHFPPRRSTATKKV